MAILKDPSQLNFYISGLQRWATIAEATGTSKKILADLVLTHAFDQAPSLCKEMSEHFGDGLSQNKEGINKIVEWLKEKFRVKKGRKPDFRLSLYWASIWGGDQRRASLKAVSAARERLR